MHISIAFGPCSTLSARGGRQNTHGQNDGATEEVDPNGSEEILKKRRKEGEREKELQRQEETIRLMAEERRMLEEEMDRLRGEKEALEERRQSGRGKGQAIDSYNPWKNLRYNKHKVDLLC